MTKHINQDPGDTSKPDLLSFLRIRKKSIDVFLSENNIQNTEDLLKFIEGLKESFCISSDIIDLMLQFFSSEEEEVLDDKQTLEEAAEQTSGPDDQGSSEREKKPSRTKSKTRSRKSNKNSSN